MSRKDSINSKLKKKMSENESAKAQISDGFLSSIQKLMIDFQDRVDKGSIEVKDPNDLYKLFVIFNQMQELSGDDGGSGTLPPLAMNQKESFGDLVKENGDEDLIDEEAFSELSADDIAELIVSKEKEMNKSNSETF